MNSDEHTAQKFSDKKIVGVLSLLSLAMFTIGTWRNSYAYTYYSAATQAATKSWKAFFFGSFDSANFMTVDKPPFSIWMSALFTRTFGFNSFWILFPHALAGAGCTYLIYMIVKRQFDSKTALVASLFFLITPITTVVFRYNITDSFLVFFVLLSIYFFIRSLETSKLLWLLYSAIAIGFAFNTKMSQGLVVVPIFAVMYVCFANKSLMVRIVDTFLFGMTSIIFSLWWVLIVALTPASERPYIGSTKDNSIWELIFVHNGFGRFFGNSWKQPAADKVGVAFGGKIGFFRIFNTGFGPKLWQKKKVRESKRQLNLFQLLQKNR